MGEEQIIRDQRNCGKMLSEPQLPNVPALVHTTYHSIYHGVEFISSPIKSRLGEGNGTPLQYSCLENPMNGGTC